MGWVCKYESLTGEHKTLNIIYFLFILYATRVCITYSLVLHTFFLTYIYIYLIYIRVYIVLSRGQWMDYRCIVRLVK